MFFITGIWTSSLVKLYHYTAVLLGFRQWKGRGEDKHHAAMQQQPVIEDSAFWCDNQSLLLLTCAGSVTSFITLHKTQR